MSTLRDARNQADYVLIAPRRSSRRSRCWPAHGAGSRLAGVAFEEIVGEFGHGEPSAEAIRAFVAHAYHRWSRPSVRYVVLLGDSTYDPRNFRGQRVGVSAAGAVGEDELPVDGVGPPARGGERRGRDPGPGDRSVCRRRPAEAEALVSKLLAWEESGQGLGGRAVLVADDPDAAGDFEAGVEDIRASFLGGRKTSVLKLRELGTPWRCGRRSGCDPDAFDGARR
jgi:hypothetical protein